MTTESLPLTETLVAESESHVSEVLRSANESGTAIYPIGGGTSLGCGLPGKSDGIGLQLTGLNEVVDYPSRDMTITVGAGITISALRDLLGAESQQLPIDVPQPDIATLGGVIATNHSGPRRYGHGTMRDHVIGIRAADGRGDVFAAGGRVVKNVAGYDFCKLLTGSFGTLGVITEVTLKLKPIPSTGAFVTCQPNDLQHAETLLAAMIESETTPNLIELLYGDAWQNVPGNDDTSDYCLIVGFEGTRVEVDWMKSQLTTEWKSLGATAHIPEDSCGDALYHQLVGFSDDSEAAMVVKMTGVPSGVTRNVEALRLVDENVSIQAHAGNGVVVGKFPEYPGGTTALKAVASAAHGSATILSNPGGAEMTHHNVWGTADVPFHLMRRVKEAFDPNNVLNPGRFVY